MMATDDEVRLAYTYAWWLTGDEERAQRAVLDALGRPDVPGADAQLRVEILLRRVRTSATKVATMCPASELALLHDSIGLPLPSAAGLCDIDARDARTELAHGRLEALNPIDLVEIIEPERLGGLAVGNPADIAATRQNPKLADIRNALLKGRDELVGLAEVPLPDDFMSQARRVSSPPAAPPTAEPEVDAPASDLRAPAGEDDPPVVGDAGDAGDDVDLLATLPVEEPPLPPISPDTEEVDLSGKIDDPGNGFGGRGAPSTAVLWAIVGVALVVGILAIIFAMPDKAFDGDTSAADDPVIDVPTDDGSDLPASDVPVSDPPASDPSASDPIEDVDVLEGLDGVAVISMRAAVGAGADPSDGPVQASPTDLLSFEVVHRGASSGDVLIAEWLSDGRALPPDETVTLTESLDGDVTGRFSRQVPLDGWPVGDLQVTLRLEGEPEPLASVTVTIIDDGTG